jgi:Transposase domain (DUF772)
MLCCISILGGLLIMMWQHARGEALLYHFDLKKNKYQRITVAAERLNTSASRLGQRLKDRCSETGRPSVDPKLLLRILLIGYLYGIASERKLAP